MNPAWLTFEPWISRHHSMTTEVSSPIRPPMTCSHTYNASLYWVKEPNEVCLSKMCEGLIERAASAYFFDKSHSLPGNDDRLSHITGRLLAGILNTDTLLALSPAACPAGQSVHSSIHRRGLLSCVPPTLCCQLQCEEAFSTWENHIWVLL